MPLPGFEPGFQPPQGCVLSAILQGHKIDKEKLFKYIMVSCFLWKRNDVLAVAKN